MFDGWKVEEQDDRVLKITIWDSWAWADHERQRFVRWLAGHSLETERDLRYRFRTFRVAAEDFEEID